MRRVERLDLVISFRLDGLAALMTLLISGIGVLVFLYASGYFTASSEGLARFCATLVAFTASMLGLVWADSVWTLFLFWELTSITSFLLVGQKNTDPAARLAARRALVITVGGGLCLLAGFVLLVDGAGSASLDNLPVVTGTTATVSAVLILLAAATKSAQVPFHVWLPGAMAAPTPVSAFLHSATMVKAGVLVMATASPALSGLAVWKPLGLSFGVASMLWGAYGALRHLDAKLILAWGTVSQLGLLISLLALATPKATFAAVSILFAHALFKAALFMVVGEIDVRTGTRTITELHGLRSSMPLAFAVTVAAAASMAGIPPLLGFPAKEAAIEAVLGLTGSDRVAVIAVVLAGSVLTVAYTTRLVMGLFGPMPAGTAATTVAPARPLMALPAAVLAAAGLAGYALIEPVNRMVRNATAQVNDKATVYALIRWPGLTDAFVASAAVVAAGLAVGWLLARRGGLVGATAGSVAAAGSAPRPFGAQLVDRSIDGIGRLARIVAGRVQHGSLPGYLLTMAATAALATIPFAMSLWNDGGTDTGGVDRSALYRWDNTAQAVLSGLVIAAAIGAARVGSRLGAALGLGAVGVGVSGLFVAHGAPDLALTQLLVETVVVVGFVIGLGHLSTAFPAVGAMWRSARLAIAALVGIAVALGLAATASAPSAPPPVEELSRAAADEGGGNNVVNVILTDIRGLDTMGEIVVLAVVAIGVLALHRAGAARPDRTAEPQDASVGP